MLGIEPTLEEIFDKYVTPGLKRNELTRWGKRMQLAAAGLSASRVKEILDELYGEEPTSAITQTTSE